MKDPSLSLYPQFWLVARDAVLGKVEGGKPFSILRRLSPTWDAWPQKFKKQQVTQTPSKGRKSFVFYRAPTVKRYYVAFHNNPVKQVVLTPPFYRRGN